MERGSDCCTFTGALGEPERSASLTANEAAAGGGGARGVYSTSSVEAVSSVPQSESWKIEIRVFWMRKGGTGGRLSWEAAERTVFVREVEAEVEEEPSCDLTRFGFRLAEEDVLVEDREGNCMPSRGFSETLAFPALGNAREFVSESERW